MKPLTTLYRGDPTLESEGNVFVDGAPLALRLDLRNHSPTGFSWGYGGSGPAQLSLAILADFLQDDKRAQELYQPFKWRVVASLPRERYWKITGQEIAGVVAVLEHEMRSRV